MISLLMQVNKMLSHNKFERMRYDRVLCRFSDAEGHGWKPTSINLMGVMDIVKVDPDVTSAEDSASATSSDTASHDPFCTPPRKTGSSSAEPVYYPAATPSPSPSPSLPVPLPVMNGMSPAVASKVQRREARFARDMDEGEKAGSGRPIFPSDHFGLTAKFNFM
jgi:hypothetical protein